MKALESKIDKIISKISKKLKNESRYFNSEHTFVYKYSYHLSRMIDQLLQKEKEKYYFETYFEFVYLDKGEKCDLVIIIQPELSIEDEGNPEFVVKPLVVLIEFKYLLNSVWWNIGAGTVDKTLVKINHTGSYEFKTIKNKINFIKKDCEKLKNYMINNRRKYPVLCYQITYTNDLKMSENLLNSFNDIKITNKFDIDLKIIIPCRPGDFDNIEEVTRKIYNMTHKKRIKEKRSIILSDLSNKEENLEDWEIKNYARDLKMKIERKDLQNYGRVKEMVADQNCHYLYTDRHYLLISKIK